jgi:2-haloacid dehalogenase
VQPLRPVDTAVFDLGGVLIHWDPRAAFRDVLPGDAVEPFLEEISFHDLNRGIDAGRRLADVEAEVDERFPHHAGVLAAYHRNFPDTLTHEIPGTADIVRELADAGVRLLALTNWSDETFPHARRMFEILRAFEAIVVSGEELMIKPDPRIFQILIDRYRLDPAATAYVDDVAVNVESAGNLGLRAVQFRDAPTLRADLSAMGLPLAARP